MAERERPGVLIIDDEIGMCRTLSAILCDQGYRVRMAYTAAAGLRLLEEEPAAVTLLDLRLPDRDGVELLEELRARYPEMKVIVITAYGEREKLGLVRELSYAYLEKPLDLERTLALIDRAVGLPGPGLGPDDGFDELMQALGARIRELRRRRGLTQESLYRRTGLPQSYISDLERGKRNVSLRNLYRLARALEVPLAEFFRE